MMEQDVVPATQASQIPYRQTIACLSLHHWEDKVPVYTSASLSVYSSASLSICRQTTLSMTAALSMKGKY